MEGRGFRKGSVSGKLDNSGGTTRFEGGMYRCRRIVIERVTRRSNEAKQDTRGRNADVRVDVRGASAKTGRTAYLPPTCFPLSPV